MSGCSHIDKYDNKCNAKWKQIVGQYKDCNYKGHGGTTFLMCFIYSQYIHYYDDDND